MKGIIRRLRPSPAMVVACIALVFAMTGAGYAAGMLGPNTVGTKQLKKNAVISSKVKNGSLLGRTSRQDSSRGPQGPQGAQGSQGAQGTQGPAGPIPGRHPPARPFVVTGRFGRTACPPLLRRRDPVRLPPRDRSDAELLECRRAVTALSCPGVADVPEAAPGPLRLRELAVERGADPHVRSGDDRSPSSRRVTVRASVSRSCDRDGHGSSSEAGRSRAGLPGMRRRRPPAGSAARQLNRLTTGSCVTGAGPASFLTSRGRSTPRRPRRAPSSRAAPAP